MKKKLFHHKNDKPSKNEHEIYEQNDEPNTGKKKITNAMKQYKFGKKIIQEKKTDKSIKIPFKNKTKQKDESTFLCTKI